MTTERVEHTEEEEEEVVEVALPREEPQQQYSALYTTINMDRFRILLLRLFTYCQLSFNLVERPEFRELLLYIQPTIDRYLLGRTTISSWVVDEFDNGSDAVKSAISKARP